MLLNVIKEEILGQQVENSLTKDNWLPKLHFAMSHLLLHLLWSHNYPKFIVTSNYFSEI